MPERSGESCGCLFHIKPQVNHSPSLNTRFLPSKVEGDDNVTSQSCEHWRIMLSGAWHTVDPHLGCAQFFGLLQWNYFDKGVEVACLRNRFVYRVTFGVQASEAGWLFVGHWAVWRPGATCLFNIWMFVWPAAQKRTKHICIISPREFHSSMRRKNWVSTPNMKPQDLSRDPSSQFHPWSQKVPRSSACSGNSLDP